MAESEENHRHRLEEKMVDNDVWARRAGQIGGWLIAMTVVVGGLILIGSGKGLVGFAAVLIPLAVLVGLFVYNQERGPGRVPALDRSDGEEPSRRERSGSSRA